MAATKIRGNTQIIPGTIGDAELAANAAIATTKLADGANFLKRDGSVVPTADISLGGNKLINLSAAITASDGPNWGQVQALVLSSINGLDWKNNVRVATVNNINLTLAPAAVDGVTLAAGNRVLVKNQAVNTQNGLYIFNGAGAAMTRAPDADSDAEVTANLAVFVAEGTQKGTQWQLTAEDPISVGITGLPFAQIGATTSYTGIAGINIAGTVISPVYGTGSDTICQGNDARLSNPRTPVDTPLATAQIWVGTPGGVAAPVALSGDATLSALGVLALNSSTVVKVSNVVKRETPAGTINGSNTVFTLAAAPVAGTEEVFLNGILQDSGAGNDYTIAGSVITFLVAPVAGDKIRVNYLK